MIMENSFITCGYCPFFKYWNYEGCGRWCLSIFDVKEKNDCLFLRYKSIDASVALKVLHYFQTWRRGGDGLQPNGHLVGLALDEAIRSLRNDNRAGIR